MEAIGIRIRAQRKQLQLSQELLAERLYISQATLSNIENNRSVPDVFLLSQLAKELNLELQELIPIINNSLKEKPQQNIVLHTNVINQLIEKSTAPYLLLNDQYQTIIVKKISLSQNLGIDYRNCERIINFENNILRLVLLL